MNDLDHRVWAYLHNELSPENRKRFEQELENDPALQQALDERLSTHQALAELLPQLDITDTGTSQEEEQLLAEWEAEHPEYREPSKTSSGKIIRLGIPLAAAAAAMFLLLAPPRPSGPIHWQRTSYGSAPQLRGDITPDTHYSRSELKQVVRELQQAIDETFVPQQEVLIAWKLQIHFQELVNGALTVEITGHPRKAPDQIRIWNMDARNLDSLREAIPGFAKQVADELAEQDGP